MLVSFAERQNRLQENWWLKNSFLLTPELDESLCSIRRGFCHYIDGTRFYPFKILRTLSPSLPSRFYDDLCIPELRGCCSWSMCRLQKSCFNYNEIDNDASLFFTFIVWKSFLSLIMPKDCVFSTASTSTPQYFYFKPFSSLPAPTFSYRH